MIWSNRKFIVSLKNYVMKAKAIFSLVLFFSSVICFSQSDVRAWYADGQVFVIWELAPGTVETYAIYASPTPFTSTDDAQLVGRPFFVESIGHGLKDNLDDLTATYRVPNGQESVYQLSLTEGLFVLTPHQSDSLYFAVTKWGDNVVASGQNITDTAVDFTFDPVDDPVECHLQRIFPSPFSVDYICFAYCMWADGRQNHWEGRPDFPIMANSVKNGTPGLFLVSVPTDLDTSNAYPISIWLHGFGGNARQSLAGARKAIDIDPMEGILVAHNDRLHRDGGANVPHDEQVSWHFGWGKNYNPFDSLPLVMDTVINYTQRRYLWIDGWLAEHFNIDTERINIHGHSMGAAGATALVKCFPEHYGSATLFNTSCRGPYNVNALIFGSLDQNFPTNLQNRNNEFVRFFDIWDMYTNCSPHRDLPIIKHWHGKLDNNNTNHWGPTTVKNFRICDSTGTGLQSYWSKRNHGVNMAADMNDHWIMGNFASQQTASDNVDFAENHHSSNLSFPAFFNHRLSAKNNDPGTGLIGINNGDGDNWGTWGGYHRWGNVTETQQFWQTTAWLESNAIFPNDNSPENFLTADFAIRRPQSFMPVTGEVISWNVKDITSGNILQSGTTMVQADNLVIVPQVEVFKESIRKVLITITLGTTSSEEVSIENSTVRISPNPAYESIFTEPDWKNVSIVGRNGKEIKHVKMGMSTQTLDIAFLPPGFYFLIITTRGAKRKVGSFVKL